MTDEVRIRANQLHSEITNIENRIAVLGDINSSCQEIQIHCKGIGTVCVQVGDYEYAIDYIIDMQKQQKEVKEDEFRVL